MIHERAIVDSSAMVAEDVDIGPWTIIGPKVEIGAGTQIDSHVVIKGATKIGCNNRIHQYASIGDAPQTKIYKGEDTLLEIGDNNIIREFCTLHRGTVQGLGTTSIGNDNLLMAYVHIAHDCVIGNHTIFANNASLSGHVKVEDYSILGGLSGVHQYCTVGAYSFVGGGSMVRQDVLPYLLVVGYFAEPNGLNIVGLRRHGFAKETIHILKQAYNIIYRQSLTVKQALKDLEKMVAECKEVQLLIDGLKNSERGIVR